MTPRSLLIACCALLLAESTLAQSGGAAADRISGTWTGYMRPNDVADSETGRNPITVGRPPANRRAGSSLQRTRWQSCAGASTT